MKRLIVLMLILMFVIPAYATNDKAVTVGGTRNSYTVMDSDDTSASGDIEIPTVSRACKRVINLGLGDAFIVGTGLMGNDGTTAPGIATHDTIPKIVYADSSETAAIQWTFNAPNYFSGLVFKAMISAGSTDYTNHGFDWYVIANADATAFGSEMQQTAVAATETALATKNDILTFTPNATALAAMSNAKSITLALWNNGSSDTTTEILSVWVEYY